MTNSRRPLRLLAPLVLLLLLALGTIAPGAATAAPTEQVATRTYRVTGSTEAQIRASIDANRTGDYDAETRWFIDWSYTSVVRDGSCRVKTWKTHTRINFTYPRWIVPSDATSALRAKWTRYMSRLRLHENGHAAIGRGVARKIQATLRATTAPTCATLDRTLGTTVRRHFAAGNAADRAYDRRTKHGEAQGAVFP